MKEKLPRDDLLREQKKKGELGECSNKMKKERRGKKDLKNN